MCLVDVRVQQSDGSLDEDPLFEDVARIECDNDQLHVTELFGQSRTISGSIRSIDLVQNVIVIETPAQTQTPATTPTDADERNAGP